MRPEVRISVFFNDLTATHFVDSIFLEMLQNLVALFKQILN